MPTCRAQDHFYVCKAHLKDKGFANPIVDEKVEAEKRRKEALDRQIEEVKKEYEEAQKQKKAKKKSKDDKDKKKEDAEDDSKAEKQRDDKVGFGLIATISHADYVQIKALEAGANPGADADDGPRIFALQRLIPFDTIPWCLNSNAVVGTFTRCESTGSGTPSKRREISNA